MEIHYIDHPFSLPRDTILCLGYFDGLHKGHQELIKKARLKGKVLALLTFSLSPQQLLKKQEQSYLLNTKIRDELLEKLGVDLLIVLKIDEEFLKIEAYDFIKGYLSIFNPSHVVCGYDYRFGYKALGTPELIKQYFPITIIDQIKDKEGKISSSRIVNYLKEGDIEGVSRLLGRYYSLSGKVEGGYHLGRTIDYPTANIELDINYYLPKYGVYAAYVHVQNKKYYGMVNIGFHPTATLLTKPLVEVHLLGFKGDLYKENIAIELISFIREEKAFPSLSDLKTQLEKDKITIERILKAHE